MEVVMKTKTRILSIVLFPIVFMGCSSSLMMSKTDAGLYDDLYHNPQKTYVTDSGINNASSAPLKMDDLVLKYESILANDSIGSIDSLVYKADEEINPYERVLSTTYQDSYERRLRGLSDPRYGIDDWSVQYSDDYRYASSYDPAHYNIIIMGGTVWAEPYYMSSMFGWPSYNYWNNPWYRPWGYRPYYGFGFGWNYWSYGGYWNPWYSYGYWGYNPYAYWYSPWGGYGYGWGYDYGYWGGHHYGHHANTGGYHYGRRPTSGTIAPNYTGNLGVVNDNVRQSISEKQVVLGNEKGQSGDLQQSQIQTKPLRIENPNGLTTLNPTQQNTTVKEVKEPNRTNNTVSRPVQESKAMNPTRINSKDNAARDYNPTYTRPNSANNSDFNRPSKATYPATERPRPTSTQPGKTVSRPISSSSGEGRRISTAPSSSTRPTTIAPTRNPSSGSVGSSRSSSSGRSVSSSPKPSSSSSAPSSSSSSISRGSSNSSSSSSSGSSRSVGSSSSSSSNTISRKR